MRLAKLDEMRAEAVKRYLREAERSEQEEGQWEKLVEGDLVLLRRFEIDKHKGRKLEARWEGPFRLSDISWHGRSGRLRDINTGELVKVRRAGLQERCHLNDLKRFVERDSLRLGAGGKKGIHGITVGERQGVIVQHADVEAEMIDEGETAKPDQRLMELALANREMSGREVVYVDFMKWGNCLPAGWENLHDFTTL